MANNHNVNSARFSAINAKQQCPLWAWLVYKKKVDGYQNPYAKLGIAIHDLLEDYAKHCIKHQIATDYEYFHRVKFIHFTKIEPHQFADANQIADSIVDSYNWAPHLNHDVIYIEKRFALDKDFNPVDEADDSYVSGAIDFGYADNYEGYLTDYKTVRSVYTKSFIKESLQRKMYSFFFLKHHPHLDRAGFIFDFVRYGFKTPPTFMYREDMPEVEDQIRAEVESLNAVLALEEPPEPCAGPHCVLCSGRANCSAYKNAFDLNQRIDTLQGAEALYRQFRVGKVRLEAIEATLKMWISENTPIQIRGEVYGPVPENEVKYPDTGKLIETLKEAGVPLGSIYDSVSMSNTVVKGIIKKFKLPAGVQEKIDKLAVKGTITKFKAKKVKVADDDVQEDEELITDPYL